MERDKITQKNASLHLQVSSSSYHLFGNVRARLKLSEQEQNLLDAASSGQEAVVMKILEDKNNSVNVNACDFDGTTAIYWAAKRGYENIVLALLEAKAIPQFHRRNEHLIHIATEKKMLKVVSILLKSNPSLADQDCCGKTPRMIVDTYKNNNEKENRELVKLFEKNHYSKPFLHNLLTTLPQFYFKATWYEGSSNFFFVYSPKR